MSFAIQDISASNFQHLNDFFAHGFDGDQLVEHSQKISLPFAEVQSHDWYFDGIRMSYSDWHYQQPLQLKWNYDIKIELVTLMINLKGSVFRSGDADLYYPLLGNYQHNLFYSNVDEVDEGILKCEGKHSSMFLVQFTKDAFLRLTKDGNSALNRFNENVLNRKPTLLSAGNLPVNATMRNMVSNIVNCIYTGGLKKMYLLSKSIELLVMQAEACNTDLTSSNYIKTNYDKDCIIYAREYIMNNLETPPSLSELAKIIGINEYKLKRGFKEMFGNTVFGYLSDTRLEIAKNDLLENKKTASEIAMELGYSSVQHFSKAFKKKFGSSPSKLKY